MAEFTSPFDSDSGTPAILGKTDALIARHRGSGPDLQVPVLTDLVVANSNSEIPVLTDVAPVIGDELMFTPEEIRAEPAPAAAKPIATAAAAVAPPSPAPQAAPPAPVASAAIPGEAPAPAVPASAKPFPLVEAAAPVAAPTRPAARPFPSLGLPAAAPAKPQPQPVAPILEMPELPLPGRKPAPIAHPEVGPALGSPLMPELSLDFDFEPPRDDETAAETAISLALPEAIIEIAPPPAEPIDHEALVQGIAAALLPKLEQLVRSELARQFDSWQQQAAEQTMATLAEQLPALVRQQLDTDRPD